MLPLLQLILENKKLFSWTDVGIFLSTFIRRNDVWVAVREAAGSGAAGPLQGDVCPGLITPTRAVLNPHHKNNADRHESEAGDYGDEDAEDWGHY